ncbi:MAG: response regulator [Lachnospiraceae bacterium]
MYQVVIVDDEPIIVEGLTKVVPWEKYGCQVAATAGSGKEGLEVIRDRRPDLVFTDISMPGVNGLNMLAALRREFPDMLVSILTGYRDFDYAQAAIRLGVVRFLLKPSNMTEIEEAVETMVRKARSRKQTEQVGSADMGPDREEDMLAEDQNANSFVVKQALQYIDEFSSRKITLNDVAEHVYVSQWHLSRLLNRHTGQSFSKILNRSRIEKAKILLEDPALRIGDVAEEVGFVDSAHFSSVFKKLEGISANEYRNTRVG